MTIYIIIGTIVGCILGIIIGHLISARKSGVLQSQLKMQQEHSAELLRNDQSSPTSRKSETKHTETAGQAGRERTSAERGLHRFGITESRKPKPF